MLFQYTKKTKKIQLLNSNLFNRHAIFLELWGRIIFRNYGINIEYVKTEQNIQLHACRFEYMKFDF